MEDVTSRPVPQSDMVERVCALAVKHSRSAAWVLDQYAQREFRRLDNRLSLGEIRVRQRERLGFDPSFSDRIESAIARLQNLTRDGSSPHAHPRSHGS